MKKRKAITGIIIGVLIIAAATILVIIIPGYYKFLIAIPNGIIGGSMIGKNSARLEILK